MINIKELTKIATGGQAEIYDLQNGKVLRLMLRAEDKHLIDYEYQSLKIVRQNGLHVPEVFEIVTVDNRPGIIMEKIYGCTLTNLFQKKPYLLFNKTKELSEIHSKLNKIKAPDSLVDLKSRISKLVDKSSSIDYDYKNFVYDLLNQLPDGNKLCHGDFHPGNLIANNGAPYIIDWGGVTKADPIADVAHTYLLFRNVPKLPGTLNTSYKVLKLAGFLASNTYLKTYKKNYEIDMNLFSKWLLVRAAERTYYGMLSEKENLIKFIKRCKMDYTNQNGNYRWHKFL